MKNKLLFIATCLVIGALLGLRSYWINTGEHRTQARWDAERTAATQAALDHQKQQIKNRLETESRITQQNERITQNDYKRTQIMEARIDELSLANNRLQRTIEQQRADLRRLSAAPSASSSCTAPDDATARSWDVLPECTTEYTALASDAERLSRQVAGLQDYARLCQQQQP